MNQPVIPGPDSNKRRIFEESKPNPKRGKDIKCFADLPPDVQQTIDSLSMVDGKICQRVKANRTAIAINYQHLFPDRFHSTGIDVKLELTEPTMEPTPRISERIGS